MLFLSRIITHTTVNIYQCSKSKNCIETKGLKVYAHCEIEYLQGFEAFSIIVSILM